MEFGARTIAGGASSAASEIGGVVTDISLGQGEILYNMAGMGIFGDDHQYVKFDLGFDQEFSQYARSITQQRREGASYLEIAGPAALSAGVNGLTLGGYEYGMGMYEFSQTGNSTRLEGGAGSMGIYMTLAAGAGPKGLSPRGIQPVEITPTWQYEPGPSISSPAVAARPLTPIVYDTMMPYEASGRFDYQVEALRSKVAPSEIAATRNLAKYSSIEYAERVMARASQRSLNRALNEGLSGRAAGTRAEAIFENYAYEMQLRFMASDSPYRITLQPAAEATTGIRAIARTKTSFAGRWSAGTKRLDYGFYNVFQGRANTAPIVSGADFTVTPNGAIGIPGEYSKAFPDATIYGIDPVNIVR